MNRKNVEILSDRLRLRLIRASDLAEVHSLLCLPETDKYNVFGIPQNIVVTKEFVDVWIEQHSVQEILKYTFVIEDKNSKEFIGLFGFNLGKEKYKNAEIWYKIHSNFWKKGYATECVKEIIKFGFKKLELHRIEAGCAVENIGSIRVLEKSGFKMEGRLRQVLPLKSGWSDIYQFGILEGDTRS